VHPTFSPDEKRLAYSKVVIEDDIELTEVYVYEFASNTTRPQKKIPAGAGINRG